MICIKIFRPTYVTEPIHAENSVFSESRCWAWNCPFSLMYTNLSFLQTVTLRRWKGHRDHSKCSKKTSDLRTNWSFVACAFTLFTRLRTSLTGDCERGPYFCVAIRLGSLLGVALLSALSPLPLVSRGVKERRRLPSVGSSWAAQWRRPILVTVLHQSGNRKCRSTRRQRCRFRVAFAVGCRRVDWLNFRHLDTGREILVRVKIHLKAVGNVSYIIHLAEHYHL